VVIIESFMPGQTGCADKRAHCRDKTELPQSSVGVYHTSTTE
jgi:hypothetical protein